MPSTGPALVIQHGRLGPPGVLGDWMRARGIAFEVRRLHEDAALPEPDGYAFVASLGSPHSPEDEHVLEVAAEMAFLRAAVERDVPVLGLCFGGQALAVLLGSRMETAAEPELGWHTVQTSAPDVVAPGPWLQWHYHRFDAPPGSEELARSPAGCQAFRAGPHLGTQFHPESTVEIVSAWARHEARSGRLAAHGIDDGEALVAAGRRHAPAARAAAFQLFDAFARGAGIRTSEDHRHRGGEAE